MNYTEATLLLAFATGVPLWMLFEGWKPRYWWAQIFVFLIMLGGLFYMSSLMKQEMKVRANIADKRTQEFLRDVNRHVQEEGEKLYIDLSPVPDWKRTPSLFVQILECVEATRPGLKAMYDPVFGKWYHLDDQTVVGLRVYDRRLLIKKDES